jgi:chromosome segregation ATPase
VTKGESWVNGESSASRRPFIVERGAMQSLQSSTALGDGLIQSIREKEDERLQLERTVHQLRLRIREETNASSTARAAEEAKVQEVLTLEKKVGALTQRYQRAVKENVRLTSESSGFQRSLKELEEQQREIDEQVSLEG